MTVRVHLFPFRTQKLSSRVPKILGWRRPGKIGRCLHKKRQADACLFLHSKDKMDTGNAHSGAKTVRPGDES